MDSGESLKTNHSVPVIRSTRTRKDKKTSLARAGAIYEYLPLTSIYSMYMLAFQRLLVKIKLSWTGIHKSRRRSAAFLFLNRRNIGNGQQGTGRQEAHRTEYRQRQEQAQDGLWGRLY